MTDFAKRLFDELEFQDKTQKELAEFLGTKSSTVHSWATRDSIPSADTALKVADFLGVPLSYLITGEKEPESESPKQNEADDRNLSPGDRADIERFAEVYPVLSPAEKRMIMASLEAAAKSTEAASSGLRATS